MFIQIKNNPLKLKFSIFVLIVFAVLSSCNSSSKKEVGHSKYADLSKNTANMENISYSPMEQSTDDKPSSLHFTPSILVAEDNLNSEYYTQNEPPKSTEKKIIKNGNMSIETKNIAVSKKGIDNLVKQYDAYYENEGLENESITISYELEIRVPANNFEKLVLGLENGKDEVKNKHISARDVTTEYIDLETRLNNKRQYLKRYKELLSKASTVKDILEIEENIRGLQEEIESTERQLNYLSKQVAFSTLSVHLYQEKAYVYKPLLKDSFSERVKKSLSNGWEGIVDFVLWTITIWPFILFVVLFIFIIRRITKRRKYRKAQ